MPRYRIVDIEPHTRKAARGARCRVAGATGVARERSGQALVEFAIVLPLLLLGAFIILHVGLALHSADDQEQIAADVAQFARADQNPGAEKGQSLQEWAKKQGDNDIVKKGKVCITFPNGPKLEAPVTVEFTTTMKWLPNVAGSSVNAVLGGVANFTIKQTATQPLYQVPSKVKAGCA